MVVEKACRGIGRKGERCCASRLPDSDYCVFHDPEHADAMFQAMLVDGQGAAELGGEDPLRPLFRELLERSKAGLTYGNRFLEGWAQPSSFRSRRRRSWPNSGHESSETPGNHRLGGETATVRGAAAASMTLSLGTVSVLNLSPQLAPWRAPEGGSEYG